MSLPLALIQQFSAGTPVYDLLVTRQTTFDLPVQLMDCNDHPIELSEDAVYTAVINDLQGNALQALSIVGQDNSTGFLRVALTAAQSANLPAPTPSKRSNKSLIGRWDLRVTDGETVLLLKGDVWVVDPQTGGQ